MPNEKIYVGRARYRDTQYGEMCNIWLTPEGIEAINGHVDNRGGINLVMNEMRNPDRAGFTHVLTVDDWKPGQSTRRHGPQRRDDGDSRRYAGRDTGRPDNRGPSRRDDGGFGAYGNGEHRYGPEDRDPPAANRANDRPDRPNTPNRQDAGTSSAKATEDMDRGNYGQEPNAETVSPEPFPEQDIERGPQTDPNNYSDIVDDDIPF